MRTWQLDASDFTDRRVFEPGELLERRKQFLLANQDPEPVARDVGDFNVGSASSRRCGFHSDAPQPVSRLPQSVSARVHNSYQVLLPVRSRSSLHRQHAGMRTRFFAREKIETAASDA